MKLCFKAAGPSQMISHVFVPNFWCCLFQVRWLKSRSTTLASRRRRSWRASSKPSTARRRRVCVASFLPIWRRCGRRRSWRRKVSRRRTSRRRRSSFSRRMTKFQVMKGGLHSTQVAFLLLTQQPRVQFLAFPKIYFDVAEIYRQYWLEESRQSFENVDWTQVRASGKLVLHKSFR